MEAAQRTLCFVPAGGPLLYENITFVYNSEQLNGTQRVLLDNVLSEEQCRELHGVASVRTGKGEPSALAQLSLESVERRREAPLQSVLSLEGSVLEEGSHCPRMF